MRQLRLERSSLDQKAPVCADRAMMPDSESDVLSKDLLETRLSEIDLLQAMYPSEDEVIIEDSVLEWIDELKRWCMRGDEAMSHQLNGTIDQVELEHRLDTIPETLSLLLYLKIDSEVKREPRQVGVSIVIPVRVKTCSSVNEVAVNLPPLKVRLRQPSWMSKQQTIDINQALLQNCGEEQDLFSTIDYLREQVEGILAANHTTTARSSEQTKAGDKSLGLPENTSIEGRVEPIQRLIRVWFYFPSLSTRSKRNDLVVTAPHYDLTGFVLAGKPGILCLEGHSENIDSYMKYIKTESWGDIPSHQKKVSERHREVIEMRVFGDMQEITEKDWMGEKRGERGNRNDLKALEVWLNGMELGDAFEKVLM